MKLESIGFYTLSDQRCCDLNPRSPIARAEWILTSGCNFSCGYCRGVDSRYYRGLSVVDFEAQARLIAETGLLNIRLSGGEPTCHPDLLPIVRVARKIASQRLAISTNGSAPWDTYEALIDSGVDDFSVSLDACCAAGCQKMSGGVDAWDVITENIRRMAARVYTTVGVVLTRDNAAEAEKIIGVARDLGVADVRVIPAAQEGPVGAAIAADFDAPILRYRLERFAKGLPVRGITAQTSRCPLVLDDVAVMGDWHFPCIIYMREQGDAIGRLGPSWRADRLAWFLSHNCAADPICAGNCLDVCQEHNARCMAVNPWLTVCR